MKNLQFGLFIVGLVFIYMGTRVDQLGLIYILIGVAFLIPPFLGFLKQKDKEQEVVDTIRKEIRGIKANGSRVSVNLDEVVIKSHSWTEENLNDHTKYAGLNDYVGEGQRNVDHVDHNLSLISAKISHQGPIQTYQEVISIDEKTLLIKFALQKTTYAYIDRQNPENVFLDLDFLKT